MWIPTVIDAYHVIKIESITLVIRNAGAAAAQGDIYILKDSEDVANLQIGRPEFDCIQMNIEIPANDSKILVFNDLDWIVGDFIKCGSSNANYSGTAIMTYTVVKTSFDQYGQCEKTLKRSMGAQ